MKALKLEKSIKYNLSFDLKDISKFLVERFLYDNDSEALNILLNIYEIESSVNNINPEYLSLNVLKKDILKFLVHKEGKELIAYNLSQLIHSDINRFELFLYLEGYKSGLNSIKDVNKLEILTYRYFNVEDLYSRKKLFNYEYNNPEVLNLKYSILNDLKNNYKFKRHIFDIVFKFNLKVIKRKVFDLNKHLDKQIVFNFDYNEAINDVKFKETNSFLNKKELYGLNRKILRFLVFDGVRIFENAFWDGVNDKVMKRYK